MDRGKATDLRGVLSAMCAGGYVEVVPDANGARVMLSGPEQGSGMSGPRSGVNTYISMSDNGPLMRFLMNGSL